MINYRIFNHDTRLIKVTDTNEETLTILSFIEIDDVKYIVTNMTLSNSDDLNNPIIDVYVEKAKYCYKITNSENENIIFSKQTYTTQEDAYQAMLEDALKVIQDEIIEDYSCNDMMKSYRFETTDNSIKIKFSNNIYYLYELL